MKFAAVCYSVKRTMGCWFSCELIIFQIHSFPVHLWASFPEDLWKVFVYWAAIYHSFWTTWFPVFLGIFVYHHPSNGKVSINNTKYRFFWETFTIERGILGLFDIYCSLCLSLPWKSKTGDLPVAEEMSLFMNFSKCELKAPRSPRACKFILRYLEKRTRHDLFRLYSLPV